MRNVIRGRDSRLDQERAFGAVPLIIVANPKRGAVGHIGNGVGFDNGFTIGVPPDLAGIAVDVSLRHRPRSQLAHVEPLLDNLIGVRGVDGAIGAAMPHRKLWPWALMI